jgi:hypothetical protein
MPYSKSLRAIGQSLETVHVEAFGLEKEGDSYVVRSQSLTPSRLWILSNSLVEDVRDSPGPDPKSTHLTGGEGWVCYGPFDISLLDAQGRKKRRNESFVQVRGGSKLSHLLRALGDYLDQKQASTFNISWSPDSLSVDYQVSGGQRGQKKFTVEKLQELHSHMRFRKLQP